MRQAASLPQPVGLVRQVGKHLVLIHGTGIATLRLSSPEDGSPKPELRDCQGLNGSHLAAAVFQSTKGSLGRYFALTSDGEILTLGNHILTDCKVQPRTNRPMKRFVASLAKWCTD